jgi:hypothetical protein
VIRLPGGTVLRSGPLDGAVAALLAELQANLRSDG